MDRSAVKAIVEREIGPLMDRLGLGHWEVRLSYSPENEKDGVLCRGECTRLVDYDSAHIQLNPEASDDEAEVLKTLRHELFHVILGPLDVYTEAVNRLKLDKATRRILEHLREHTIERTVINLERMWRGLAQR